MTYMTIEYAIVKRIIMMIHIFLFSKIVLEYESSSKLKGNSILINKLFLKKIFVLVEM